MILLSLASRQIWPHVLTVAHLKPVQLFLLHSEDMMESKGYAQRLKRFFDNSGLVPKGGTKMELVSDSNFDSIERQLDEIQRSHQLALPDCVVNFTGGNKLMAAAAFRWAARHARAFYLERRNQLTWFEAPDGKMITRSEQLDGHVTDHLDPVALLRCQLDASEVQRFGQGLVLNESGRQLSEADFWLRIKNGSPARPWLHITGEADREDKEGDALEYATAAVLLRLGVKQVQRSLRLKVKSSQQTGTRLPHAEIDLLFTWGGRLWLVDCKDRKPAENLADDLLRMLPSHKPEVEKLIERICKELSIGQTKVMKQDLLAVREAGGLLGQVVCVRKKELPAEVVQFADNNGVKVLTKANLADGWRSLLNPHQSASPEQLQSLAQVRTTAKA